MFLEEATEKLRLLGLESSLVIRAYIYQINKNTATKTLSIVEGSLNLLHPPQNPPSPQPLRPPPTHQSILLG